MIGNGKISWQIGTAVVAGVPALVLVSVGPIASMAGGAAVLVWALSAALGLAMAFTFAQLARYFPGVPGGLGVIGAQALSHRPWLASVARWSYWLGWSPGLAVYSAVAGNYGAALLGKQGSATTALLLSLVAIIGCTAVNYRGLANGAIVQVALGVTMLTLLLFFSGAPLASGQFTLTKLLPLAPTAGWLSWKGMAAAAGALFLAGWTTYGAELAISLASEYKRGTRDVVACLSVVAIVTFVVYVIVPALITGSIGLDRVRDDPALALLALVPPQLAAAGKMLVFAAIFVSLFLCINMVAVTSSRLLFQIARDESSFRFLGRTNRHGVPGNALLFDMSANCAMLLVIYAATGGRSADVPLALLCAANVAYFVTIVLALVGASVAAHRRKELERCPICCSHPAICAMAGVNLLLLGAAGFAWGWTNVGIGWVILLGLVATTAMLRRISGGSAASHPHTPRAPALGPAS
ncbi:MAG TPA: APC family permease [Thermoanaerobaculia bacterium]|nr:APC family permease [Thermoanaerobaculia bacterium]